MGVGAPVPSWVSIEQEARSKAVDYMQRADRSAANDEAVAAREWLDAAIVAIAIADRARRMSQ